MMSYKSVHWDNSLFVLREPANLQCGRAPKSLNEVIVYQAGWD